MDQQDLNCKRNPGFVERMDRGWCVATITGIYYLALALTRYIDADEGYFLYAARLVSEGRVPYRDFFYPQMPMLPYIWGTILGYLGGVDWIKGRLLAAVMAWGCAMIFRFLLKREGIGSSMTLFLFFAYLISDFGMEWSTTVKTYLPATFFLLTGWSLVPADRSGLNSTRGRAFYIRLFLSGVCLASAVMSRLTVAPVFLVTGIYLLRYFQRDSRPFRREAITWLTGVILPLVALWCLYLPAAQSFSFCNWSYHLLASEHDRFNRVSMKLSVLLMHMASPIWLFMLIPVLSRCVTWVKPDSGELLYLGFIITFVLAAFLPVRSFEQYYCLATPWLILLSARTWAKIGAGSRFGNKMRIYGKLRTVQCGMICMMLMIIGQFRTVLDRWPLGRNSGPGERVDHVREVSQGLDRYLGDDEFFVTGSTRSGILPPVLAGNA